MSVCSYLREPTLDLIERYRAAGVDQVILFAAAGSRGALEARLDVLARQIVEPARAY